MDETSVGQSKAKSACAFLQELNDAVKAKFIEENPDTLIITNPSFFSQFTLVIATQVHLGFSCKFVTSSSCVKTFLICDMYYSHSNLGFSFGIARHDAFYSMFSDSHMYLSCSVTGYCFISLLLCS